MTVAARRLGIDVGGTFTDATLIDEASGDIRIGKVLSTPADPSEGFLAAVQKMLAENAGGSRDVSLLVHATTVATNAIIERKTARAALVTTAGFRDILEIARQIRPALYDIHFEKPPPLVPRERCYGVPERLDPRGRVITELDEAAVARVATELRDQGVETVAVCLLHAYANPRHEQRIAQIIGEIHPDAMVSLSSDVAPEFREYLRASTTVINAAVRPVVQRYVGNIRNGLSGAGMSPDFLVMQSSGGVYSSTAAQQQPVAMVESGPAAGVIAANFFGDSIGHRDVLSFDMGGTTAKAGIVVDGVPRITKDYEVGAAAMPGIGGQRGSGYPIRTPVIELVEIGAGGGSIAWVDSGGVLRVGPQSAGAAPGPVCYSKGGSAPTVTDANLVLGRLNPAYFLGGEMPLDVASAGEAIERTCARPLGLELVEAANGIVEIANAAMVNALRLVSVQRGLDPRDFVLVAFGGAGPLHANRLAEELDIPLTLIPMSPGIASSLGLLVTDVTREHSVTVLRRLDEVEPETIVARLVELEHCARRELLDDGVAEEALDRRWQVEMRYCGQSHELGLSVDPDRAGAESLSRLLEDFHDHHEQAYGFAARSEPVEIVTLRVVAVGRIPKPRLKELPGSDGNPERALKGTRPVYFATSGGYVETPVYDRYHLPADARLIGPAIVEELDSATVVHPEFAARVDRVGNLLLTRAEED